ncbi:MAG: 3-hydroxyacyl-ACP dehydratase FabZ [Sulfurospirillum sp.]|nr:3-hydroxyacyl-ACP dehydratase FabZ [Sulfurospirillum sp.]MBL0702465.1 3-hydroxyacyl-ACP dehydratase FabZ [Sulfurospirillum sp.]
MNIDVVEIQKILPHRFPFLLVDRVTDLKEGEFIEGFKNVTIGEHIFQGHFPNHPIYPGVMIVEGMAQVGGLLAYQSYGKEEQEDVNNKIIYFMSIDKCKFRIPVTPGDRLIYKVNIIKRRGNIWVLDAKAYVDGNITCEAELKAMVVDK